MMRVFLLVYRETSEKYAAAINNLIEERAKNDLMCVHGSRLLKAAVIPNGHRTYSGDALTGAALWQADGAHLQAVVAMQSWQSNSTSQPTSNLFLRAGLTVLIDLQLQNTPDAASASALRARMKRV